MPDSQKRALNMRGIWRKKERMGRGKTPKKGAAKGRHERICGNSKAIWGWGFGGGGGGGVWVWGGVWGCGLAKRTRKTIQSLLGEERNLPENFRKKDLKENKKRGEIHRISVNGDAVPRQKG